MILDEIEQRFLLNADPGKASAMSAYLKGLFKFYGIPAPLRKELVKDLIKTNSIKDKQEFKSLVMKMWQREEREWQYTALRLIETHIKILNQDDIQFLEQLVIDKSWWDTVDALASNPIGALLLKYPEQRRMNLDKWMNSGNMWLQRTCIIHQLKWGMKTDTDYLTEAILSLNTSKEFFIQKAIGWSLRQYAKVNPDWVRRFTEVNPLKPLSFREALKNLN